MKLVAGIAVGLVLGMTVSAFASVGGYFFSKHEISTEARSYLLGYTAGVHDALSTFAVGSENQNGFIPDFIKERYSCLDGHAGGTLGDFTDWAMGVVKTARSDINNVAHLMIFHACGET